MTTDFTEKNRQVFDKQSQTYQTEFAKAVETLVKTVQAQRAWFSDTWTDTKAGEGKEIRMLEYACGPGHISLALAPFVTSVTGLDISDGMISEYNKNARKAGLSKTVTGLKANLLAEMIPVEVSGPEFYGFDFVIVSMAVHHFEDPEVALRKLGERVRKGGVLVIIDLVPEHGREHGSDHDGLQEQMGEVAETISSHGFSFSSVRGMFEGAGVGGRFGYRVVEEALVLEKNGRVFEKTVFVARGEKI